MFISAALLGLAQLDAPKTVKGAVLRSAEEFTTFGPAVVCMSDMAIRVEAGESAQLYYSGIHVGTIRLIRDGQHIDFMHGDNWAEPKEGTFATRNGKLEFYRSRLDGRMSYLLYALDEAKVLRPTVWINGPAISGAARDFKLLRRISLSGDQASECDRRYSYGFDVLYGEKPLSQDKQ